MKHFRCTQVPREFTVIFLRSINFTSLVVAHHLSHLIDGASAAVSQHHKAATEKLSSKSSIVK